MNSNHKLICIRGEHWEVIDKDTGETICSGDTRTECLNTYEEIETTRGPSMKDLSRCEIPYEGYFGS